MEKPKLSIRKASTPFGLAIQEAIEKGKGNTSKIEQYKLIEIQKDSAITERINSLIKEILEPEEKKRASLAKRRAKVNHVKTKNKETSTEQQKNSESLRKQLSSASKEINELKKKLNESYKSNLESNQKKLLHKAVIEIKKYKERVEILQKENKTLREIIAKNLAKSLPLSGEMIFYGGQYSNPET